MLKILWKRGEIAPEEQFLLLSTIFCYLMLDFYVKTGIRFHLRDKRLFEITEVEITRVHCTFRRNLSATFTFTLILSEAQLEKKNSFSRSKFLPLRVDSFQRGMLSREVNRNWKKFVKMVENKVYPFSCFIR